MQELKRHHHGLASLYISALPFRVMGFMVRLCEVLPRSVGQPLSYYQKSQKEKKYATFPGVLAQDHWISLTLVGSCSHSSINHLARRLWCSDWPSLCHTLTLSQGESTPSETGGVTVGSGCFLREPGNVLLPANAGW